MFLNRRKRTFKRRSDSHSTMMHHRSVQVRFQLANRDQVICLTSREALQLQLLVNPATRLELHRRLLHTTHLLYLRLHPPAIRLVALPPKHQDLLIHGVLLLLPPHMVLILPTVNNLLRPPCHLPLQQQKLQWLLRLVLLLLSHLHTVPRSLLIPQVPNLLNNRLVPMEAEPTSNR